MNRISYTPEWFEQKSSDPDFQAFKEEEERLQKSFSEKYGPDILRKKHGSELLKYIFYPGDDNLNCMHYILEFKPEYAIFGTISGGSAYKFDLYHPKDSDKWVTGNHQSNARHIDEEEAVKIAEDICARLIDCCNSIEKLPTPRSKEECKNVTSILKKNGFSNRVWIKKYLYLIYPEKLIPIYSDKLVKKIAKNIGCRETYDMSSNIAAIKQFIDSCNITGVQFMEICKRADPNSVSYPASSDIYSNYSENGSNHWIIGVPDRNTANAYLRDGTISIGYDDLGNFSPLETEDQICDLLKLVRNYTTNKHSMAQNILCFKNRLHKGDIVFLRLGNSEICAAGRISDDIIFDDSREYGKNFRRIEWISKKTVDIDKKRINSQVQLINDSLTDDDLIEDYGIDVEKNDAEDGGTGSNLPIYDKDSFLDDVFMDEEEYDDLRELVLNKKNVIIQGPPGVGKTFLAQRLAYSIIGTEKTDRVMMVQFHQSYTYEDFVMGYRPTENGFTLNCGAFYNFCKKAKEDPDCNDYFFIIDEINRGNISKIFGELFMLIENNKRDVEMNLMYNNERFCVPSNVYIIGMMNTADRGLAMIDYALRRRFAFFSLKPAFEKKSFINFINDMDSPSMDSLLSEIKRINSDISEDKDRLGPGFMIGHSYFCASELQNVDEDVRKRELAHIVRYEICPLLEEYWFDDPDKAEGYEKSLLKALGITA